MPYIGNITSDFSIDTGNITNRAVTATKLSPSSVGSNGQVLSVDGSGNLQWSADASGTALTGSTNNTITTVTGANAIQGEANLTFDGTTLSVTGGAKFTGNIFTTVLRRDVQDSSVIIAGGNATNDGANIAFYGSTHSSQAGNFEFRSGSSYVLKIKSDGKIGIGTTSPEGKLHLETGSSGSSYSADNSDVLIIEHSDSVGIDLRSPAANSGNILFSDANARGQGRIGYGHNNDGMFFCTGGVANTRMTIDSSGNVGIGTSSPTLPLNVLTTGNDAAIFESTSGNEHGVQVTFRSSSASPADDDKLAVLDFSGKDSAGNNTTYAQIRSHSRDVTNNSEDGDITFHTRLDGAFDERMRIDSAGKVGIGTTSPSEKLHVEGNIRIGGSSTASTAGDDLVIEGSSDRGLSIISGTSSSANVYFGDSDDTDIGRIAYQQTDNKLQFYVNAGKCGLQILNTGATELLHNGSLSAITAADDFDIYRRIRIHADRSSGMGGHQLAIGQWDGSNHRIEGDANRPIFITAYNSGGIKMGVSGANKVAVTSDGLTFNGDTAAANALDDYEEGYHVPTIVGSNSGSWTTATYTTLAYTKIGRVVHIGGYLNISSESSPSGAMRISLPFPVAALTHDSGNNSLSVSLRGHNGSTALYNVTAAVSEGTSYMELIAVAGTGSHTWIGDGQIDGSANIRIGGHYFSA